MRWLLPLLIAMPAHAEGLDGLSVSLHVLTREANGDVIFETAPKRRRVDGDVEYGLKRSEDYDALDVVPVLVDISARRISLDYRTAEPAELYPAEFNGYVLVFDTPCDLFRGAAIDESETTLPFGPDRVTWEGNTLYLNVEGMAYNRKSRVAIDLELRDCDADKDGSGKKSKS